jgi:RNA polymerase sigma-70 factor (ECF subfamily)
MDRQEFGAVVERHRRELQVHCYRMLGSLEDSEDLVQETFLRARRGRHGYEGRASYRAWLSSSARRSSSRSWRRSSTCRRASGRC